MEKNQAELSEGAQELLGRMREEAAKALYGQVKEMLSSGKTTMMVSMVTPSAEGGPNNRAEVQVRPEQAIQIIDIFYQADMQEVE